MRKRFIQILILIPFLAGCGAMSGSPASATSTFTTSPWALTSTATLTITASPTVAPSLTPTLTATVTPSPQPTPMGGGNLILLYLSKVDDRYQPFELNLIDGEPQPIQVGRPSWAGVSGELSHDTRFLAMPVDDDQGIWSIILYDRVTKEAKEIFAGKEKNQIPFEIQWSFDDRWLAYIVRGASNPAAAEVYTLSVVDVKANKIANGAAVAWRKDTHEIVFRAYSDEKWWRSDARGTKVEPIAFDKIFPKDIYARFSGHFADTQLRDFITEADAFVVDRESAQANDYRILLYSIGGGEPVEIPNLEKNRFEVKSIDEKWIYLFIYPGNNSRSFRHALVNIQNKEWFTITLPENVGAVSEILSVSPDGRLAVIHAIYEKESKIVIQDIKTGKLLTTRSFPKPAPAIINGVTNYRLTFSDLLWIKLPLK